MRHSVTESSNVFQRRLCTLAVNLSQTQYTLTDLPWQGKAKSYQFQLNFAILIPACARGQVIIKLPITRICSTVSEKRVL